jgi:uncharacterized protein (TIGR03437 family)
MGAVRWLPAALALGLGLWAGGGESREAPSYSAAGIVNAASNVAGPLAPYAIVSLYGAGLAYSRRAVSEKDLRANVLPTELDGVRVVVEGSAAPLYYVSPEQINFLIPYNTGAKFPTEVSLTVWLDGRRGPSVRLPLQEAAPALFQLDRETVIATHADWTLVTKGAPARPGEDIVLFATGLGRTQPAVAYPELPRGPIRIANWQRFRVLVDGKELDPGSIAYVGVTPGFAGLYQVNLRLPEDVGPNPEIRIGIGDLLSPAGLRLPVAPKAPN